MGRKTIVGILLGALSCLVGLFLVFRFWPGHTPTAAPSAGPVQAVPSPRFEPVKPLPEPLPPVADFVPDAPSPATLTVAVEAMISPPHRELEYSDYRAALLELTPNLSAADIQALVDFLRLRPSDRPALRPIEFNAVKNDILEVLLRQETLPEQVGDLLVEMHRDRSNDVMWRDYCLQFMTTYYERRWPTQLGVTDPVPEDTPEEEVRRAAMEQVYWEALTETDTTIAGTALLGLDSLSGHDSRIDRNRIATEAVRLLADAATGEPARITAFSLAASLGAADALPEARIVAQTGEPVTLRMAAIAAIGKLGTADDVELLASLANESVGRIQRISQKSAEAARRRLAGAGS